MTNRPPKYGLSFSLRTDATMELPTMQAIITRALGCALAPGEWNHMGFLMGEVLGMRILLAQNRGINAEVTFELHGIVEVPIEEMLEHEDPQITKIDPVIIDLLERKGARIWHQPSIEEIRAEAAEARRLEQEYYPPSESADDSDQNDEQP